MNFCIWINLRHFFPLVSLVPLYFFVLFCFSSRKITPQLSDYFFKEEFISLGDLFKVLYLTLEQGQRQVGLVMFFCLKQIFIQGFSDWVWRTVSQWQYRQSAKRPELWIGESGFCIILTLTQLCCWISFQSLCRMC